MVAKEQTLVALLLWGKEPFIWYTINTALLFAAYLMFMFD